MSTVLLPNESTITQSNVKLCLQKAPSICLTIDPISYDDTISSYSCLMFSAVWRPLSLLQANMAVCIDQSKMKCAIMPNVCQTSPDDDARDDTDLEDVDTNQNTDFEC
jgi:hypothetical protein